MFLACDKLVSNSGMKVYWKEVNGHSQILSPDKDGNDEADRLPKAGAVRGPWWPFQEDWFPKEQVFPINAITWRQTCENFYNSGSASQTLCLGRKPGDADLATMQKQDSVVKGIYQFVSDPQKHPISPEFLKQSSDLNSLYHLGQYLKV